MDGLCSISQSRHCHSVLSASSGGRGASSPAAYVLELQGSKQRRVMPLGGKLGPRSEGTSQAQGGQQGEHHPCVSSYSLYPLLEKPSWTRATPGSLTTPEGGWGVGLEVPGLLNWEGIVQLLAC